MRQVGHAIRFGAAALGITLVAASCSSSGVEPIEGSITYRGHQPATKLTKAPVGSTFTTQITDDYGQPAIETYQIQPDRSLKLVRRQRREIGFFGQD